MKMFKSGDIRRALTKKGFKESSSKHIKYSLYVDGEFVGIHTVMSHGVRDPGKDLLQQMKRDLQFENQDQFESFISCKLSMSDYIENLKNRGLIA